MVRHSILVTSVDRIGLLSGGEIMYSIITMMLIAIVMFVIYAVIGIFVDFDDKDGNGK